MNAQPRRWTIRPDGYFSWDGGLEDKIKKPVKVREDRAVAADVKSGALALAELDIKEHSSRFMNQREDRPFSFADKAAAVLAAVFSEVEDG